MLMCVSIKQQRKLAGLTQAQLGKLADITQTEISTYESGRRNPRNMALDTALRLASALNCHPADLVE